MQEIALQHQLSHGDIKGEFSKLKPLQGSFNEAVFAKA